MPRFSEPFSVPDPDAEAWNAMIAENYKLQAKNDSLAGLGPSASGSKRATQLIAQGGDRPQERRSEEQVHHTLGESRSAGELMPARTPQRYGSPAGLDASDATFAPITPVDWRAHPGFGESLVPVWGSGREAIADLYDKNYGGAAANAALAAADVLLPEEYIGKALGKVGIKAALKEGRSMTWKNVRSRMGRAGYFAADEQGHHWAIPQSWKWVPDAILNHPMNINPLLADIHKRVHSNDLINGLPKFNWFEGLVHGTPDWAKVMSAQTAGNVTGKAALVASRGNAPEGRAVPGFAPTIDLYENSYIRSH